MGKYSFKKWQISWGPPLVYFHGMKSLHVAKYPQMENIEILRKRGIFRFKMMHTTQTKPSAI